MSKFENLKTGVVISVDDSKDERFVSGWKRVGSKPPAASQAVRGEAPDESWSNKELKAYAEENQINLGEAKNKAGFLAAIAAAGEESEEPFGSDDDESDDE